MEMRRIGLIVGICAVCAAAWLAPLQAQTGREPSDEPRVRQPRLFDLSGASIGVTIRDLTADEAAGAGVVPAGGVRIDTVRTGSPAEQAGLRSGDVVVEFDGERVRSARHFARLVQESAIGRPVESTIVRSGARQSVRITPAAGPFERAWSEIGPAIERGIRRLPPGLLDFESFGGSGRLGLSIVPLSSQLAEHFGATHGVLVSSVDPGSPAAAAGIVAGDVITAVDGRRTTSPAELLREVRQAAGGEALVISVVRERQARDVKVLVPASGARPRGTRPV
jgi:serine protease Do